MEYLIETYICLYITTTKKTSKKNKEQSKVALTNQKEKIMNKKCKIQL